MIKKIFPYEDFLYILQLEEYYYGRFFKKVTRLFFKRGFMIHQKLVFTSRIQITYFLSVILTLYIPLLVTFVIELLTSNLNILLIIFVILLILSVLFIPFWVGISSLMLEPFYFLIKKNLQSKARRIVNEVNTKNIMIVGSYGKTTTKNFIQQLIQYNYKTQMVAGNINTPTGIAVWILNNLNKSTDILIAETDGYKLGEIADCCKIIAPDYVVVTAIGDQHLERLGSKKILAMTLLEAFKYAKNNAKFILTESTRKDFADLGFDIIKMFGKEKFVIVDENRELKTNDLSDINQYNVKLALSVCELLNIPQDFISDEVKKLKIPERRNQEIIKEGFLTLDNSYNISFNTAQAGVLEGIKRAKDLKKDLIVITGGIPELGKENKSANYEYGKFLTNNKIENIILLKTTLVSDIINGLENKNIVLVNSMADAWLKIKEEYSADKYIVLMQPELNDLYYAATNFSTISVE